MTLKTISIICFVALQIVIGYNLILPLILYAWYKIRPKSKREKRVNIYEAGYKEPDYGIIVTAYQDTTNLHFVVESLLKMNYFNFLVYIVADCCDVSGLKFYDQRVVILRPEQPLQSNVKSHFYAINNFKRQHERLTIIDSDNLVEANYLQEINRFFDQGYSAVQGVRTAKNLNTNLACLDAARDIYYHYFDGKVIFNIGSSATLAGSGMAFDTKLYKTCMEKHMDMSGAGFDKLLQSELVARDFQIAFAENAVVYDEKTAKSGQLVKQRARWINTWFKYFTNGFKLVEQGIARRNKNQFLFGVILLRPPLFIFLLLSFVCMVGNLLYHPVYALIWLAAFVIFLSGFLIALAKSDTHPKIYASLTNIPKFMFYQVVSLLKSSSISKTSVATKHYSTVSINDK
jgi:cellulose synthase/poly-beta-1,6-N-acetylglucosamine synthase-like glycosyltransferase